MADEVLALNRIPDDALLAELLGGRRRSEVRVAEPRHEALSLAACLASDPADFRSRYGVTPTQSRRLAIVGEIHRRLLEARAPQRPVLRRPEEVAALLGPRLVHLEVETFWCCALDARSCLIGEPIAISRGDVDGTDAGPRAFFRAALQRGAVSAVALHNHPSGSPDPSAADLAVTRRLCAAGRAVDVALVDHVIIGSSGFTSLRRAHPDCFT